MNTNPNGVKTPKNASEEAAGEPLSCGNWQKYFATKPPLGRYEKISPLSDVPLIRLRANHPSFIIENSVILMK